MLDARFEASKRAGLLRKEKSAVEEQGGAFLRVEEHRYSKALLLYNGCVPLTSQIARKARDFHQRSRPRGRFGRK